MDTKRCSDCGIDLPTTEFYVRDGWVMNPCKNCKKQHIAKWREDNRERHNENARRWRAKNPEKVRESNRRSHIAHGHKHAAKRREWARANRDKCREAERRYRQKPESKAILDAKNKRWVAANKAKVAGYERAWRQRNPDKVCFFAKTRRARVKNAPIVDLTKAQWESILTAFKHRCAYCGSGGKMTQDHILPLSKGGAHTASNVVPSCQSCNSRKNDGPLPKPVQPLLIA